MGSNKIIGAVHSDQVTISAATAELARAFFSMRRVARPVEATKARPVLDVTAWASPCYGQ